MRKRRTSIIKRLNSITVWFWVFVISVGIFALVVLCLRKYDTFVACLALIISVTALIQSQRNMQKTIEEQTRHNIISQRPLLQVDFNWDITKVSLSVKNGGLGLAKIIDFKILKQGQETSYRNLQELIDDVLEGKEFPIQKDTLFGTTPDASVLLPGENTVLLEMNYISQWHLEHMLDLTSALEPYSFIIEYIDVYDLDAFDEGGREAVQRLFKIDSLILEPSPEVIPADKI